MRRSTRRRSSETGAAVAHPLVDRSLARIRELRIPFDQVLERCLRIGVLDEPWASELRIEVACARLVAHHVVGSRENPEAPTCVYVLRILLELSEGDERASATELEPVHRVAALLQRVDERGSGGTQNPRT